MAKQKSVGFSVTSLDQMDDRKLNEIVDKVMKSKKGASALKSMMRSVMRSTLKSAVKSAVRSPAKSPVKSPIKAAAKTSKAARPKS